ncbi:MAG: WD40 repeat domain-containing protein, partial [Planctomycetota bacterium]
MSVSLRGDYCAIGSFRRPQRYKTDQSSIVDMETWKTLWNIDDATPPLFVGEGDKMIELDGNEIRIIDTRTGAVEKSRRGLSSTEHAVLSPDATALVVSGQVWDLKTLEHYNTSSVKFVSGWYASVSKQSPFTIARQRNWRSVDVREWQSGNFIQELQELSDIRRMVIAPDGSHLITVTAPRISLWKLNDFRSTMRECHTHWFISLAAHGKRVAIPAPGGVISLWDTSDGSTTEIENAHQFNAPSHSDGNIWDRESVVSHMAFSPNGRTLASIGFDGKVCLWDAQRGKMLEELVKLDRRGWSIAFSDDGRIAAGFEDGSILVISLGPGRSITRLEANDTTIDRALAFLPGNRLLAAGGNSDGRIRCWDIEGKTYTTVAQSERRFDGLRLSPDGTMFTACDRSGNVVLHDAKTLKHKWSVKAAGSYAASIDFSHDSKRVICGALNLVSILRASDGEELGRLRTTESVREVRVMPEGS